LRDPNRLRLLEADRVITLALRGLHRPKTALDVGTGSGIFAEILVHRGLQVSGVDANPEMLSLARSFVPTAVFKEGSAEKLPFEDGAFDLTFMGLLLHETDQPAEALHESHRVTTQRLAVLEWAYRSEPFGPPRVTGCLPARSNHFQEKRGSAYFRCTGCKSWCFICSTFEPYFAVSRENGQPDRVKSCLIKVPLLAENQRNHCLEYPGILSGFLALSLQLTILEFVAV